MCPLVRTPNQCCVDNAIKRLSFDPTLQDVVWQKAQSILRPSNSRKCPSKSADTGKTALCESSATEILEALGVQLDPWAGSLPEDRQPKLKINIPAIPPNLNEYWPTRTPTTQHAEDDSLRRLSHKNLLLPRIHLNDALFVDDEGSALLAYSPGVTDEDLGSLFDGYQAPELRDSQNHKDKDKEGQIRSIKPGPTFSTDAYAFGSLIHWMCTGRHPDEFDPPPNDELSQLGMSSNAQLLAISAQLLPSSWSHGLAALPALSPPIDPKRALFELTDYTLKTLVGRCRSSSPNSRPSLLSIGVQLNQIIAQAYSSRSSPSSSWGVQFGSDSSGMRMPVSHGGVSQDDEAGSQSWMEDVRLGQFTTSSGASTSSKGQRNIYTDRETQGLDIPDRFVEPPSLSASSSAFSNPLYPQPSLSARLQQYRPSSPPAFVYHAPSPIVYDRPGHMSRRSDSQDWNVPSAFTSFGLHPPPSLTHQHSMAPPPPPPFDPYSVSTSLLSSSPHLSHYPSGLPPLVPPHSPSPSPTPSPSPSPWVMPLPKQGSQQIGAR
ncbi:hypothetical protein FRC17_007647 [Serendipita sp. 399]|nr:hypothetical protein FRC17_007647 [Serendipita sp. 399]